MFAGLIKISKFPKIPIDKIDSWMDRHHKGIAATAIGIGSLGIGMGLEKMIEEIKKRKQIQRSIRSHSGKHLDELWLNAPPKGMEYRSPEAGL